MKIAVVTTQVPFIRGGAEIHAENLVKKLQEFGHQATLVNLPFKHYPAERIFDHILLARLADLTEAAGESIDRIIGLKFPAYLAPHPNKVLWVLHQHRAAYELWGTDFGDLHHAPNGQQVRDAIFRADRHAFAESRAVFANSRNVSNRMAKYNQASSTPLYHPPHNAQAFYHRPASDTLFFPSRLNHLMKRQTLVVSALSKCQTPVRLCIAGAPDSSQELTTLQKAIDASPAKDRIEFLGTISEEEKLSRYANALAIVFPPVDEDYGYITLEAMLASKAVITCNDSGGPLEFINHEQEGLICEPTPEALAEAFDRLYQERDMAERLGQNGNARLRALNVTWEHVINTLVTA